MSFPPSALLIHTPGVDRDAISDRLRSAGVAVRTQDDGRGLSAALRGRASETFVIVRAADFVDAAQDDRAALRSCWSVVIVGDEPAPTGFNRVVREPYFIDDLLPGRPASADDLAPTPEAREDVGPLLRGLAHALSNRVQAALGWLSFFELPRCSPEQRAEAALRTRTEVDLVGRVAQAMSILGGRGWSTAGRAADVASSIQGEVAKRGLTLHVAGVPPPVSVDPDELALIVALLVSDFEPDQGAGVVAITAESGGTRLTAPTGLEEFVGAGALAPSVVLGRVKRASSLGLLIAARAAARVGGVVSVECGADGAPRVVLQLPAYGARSRGT